MPFDINLTDYDSRIAAGLSQPRPVKTVKGTAFYRNFAKRVLDVFLVAISMVIVLPVIAIAALFVALDGHNPFYTQLRIGRNGRTFRMVKLRTMVPNAHAKLESYLASNPAARREWDATQKLKNDPRITTIGRVLRKTSLDELPQLFNVLSGSMSLVGPRPMMIEQQRLYHGSGYYDLRPGITGFWQISDRNECDFSDRVKYDEAYNRAASFFTDIVVILRTFKVVARGTGY